MSMLNKKLKAHVLSFNLSIYYKLILSGLFTLVILIISYYPIANVPLDYFHNDDVRLMGELNSLIDFRSTINFIFSLEFFKFRPVANLQYVMEHLFFANHYKAYLIYNIFLVLGLNYIFLLFVYEKTGLFVCLLISLVIVTSRFFNYSVWNITGSFETLAAIIFLRIVFFVVSDNKASNKKLIFLALMLIFTSERYLPFLVVLPIIYLYLHSHDNFIQSLLKGVKYSVAILIAYFSFRYMLSIPLIVGTQTDNVADSFSATRFIIHVLKSYSEIFYFSVGPRHETGFEFVNWVPFNALVANKVYIIGFILSVFIFVISLYYFFFKCFILKKTTLVINLISLLLIMAASVTFRLSLRWLLPSYLMMLLFFVYNRPIGKCKECYLNLRLFDGLLFFMVTILSVTYNLYYMIFFRRSLYFAEKLHDASILSYLWLFVNR